MGAGYPRSTVGAGITGSGYPEANVEVALSRSVGDGITSGIEVGAVVGCTREQDAMIIKIIIK
jgi:hypothetical protein